MYNKYLEAIKEVNGCFSAAIDEGLYIALLETSDHRLKDLIERRLLYAFYAATEALENN